MRGKKMALLIKIEIIINFKNITQITLTKNFAT